MLYKIQRKGSAIEHFLFGTMHVSSEDAFTFATLAKTLIERCQLYAAELNFHDPEMSEMPDLLRMEDVGLLDLLGQKKYDKAHRIIEKAFGVDLDEIQHFRPLVITNMLHEALLTSKYDLPLDQYLWEYAMSQNREMHGLESFQDQKRIMLSIPMDIQVKAFRSSVKDVNKFRKSTFQLSELYAKGELRKLYKKAKRSIGELRKLMIYDRNRYMADRFKELSMNGSLFAAVGAAHLPSKKGMLNLLKQDGFKITLIK